MSKDIVISSNLEFRLYPHFKRLKNSKEFIFGSLSGSEFNSGDGSQKYVLGFGSEFDTGDKIRILSAHVKAILDSTATAEANAYIKIRFQKGVWNASNFDYDFTQIGFFSLQVPTIVLAIGQDTLEYAKFVNSENYIIDIDNLKSEATVADDDIIAIGFEYVGEGNLDDVIFNAGFEYV